MVDLNKYYGALFDDARVPGAIEATPDPSPESTLSSDEAKDLKNFIIHQGKQEVKAKRGLDNPHISCLSPSLESIFL